MQGLRPVKNKKISEQVFMQLLDNIKLGIWKQGMKLPSESELGEKLGVSRTSVRSALEKLSALDLIETRQGEGSYVKGFSTEVYINSLLPMVALDVLSLIDIMEYRVIVETGIMPAVINNITEEDINMLEKTIKILEKFNDDNNIFIKADSDFHNILARVSNNHIICKVDFILKDILNLSMKDMMNLTNQDVIKAVEKDKGALYFHKGILNAIKSKNIELAQKFMRDHINENIQKLKANI